MNATANRDEIRHFCTMCFADNVSGSWQHTTIKGFCSNCGAAESTVDIPAWAVASIRENASWVGRRYYPNQEDRKLIAELRMLRRGHPTFWGRTAEPTSDPGRWSVKQTMPDRTWIMITVAARNEAEALEAAKAELPVVLEPSPPEQDAGAEKGGNDASR